MDTNGQPPEDPQLDNPIVAEDTDAIPAEAKDPVLATYLVRITVRGPVGIVPPTLSDLNESIRSTLEVSTPAGGSVSVTSERIDR